MAISADLESNEEESTVKEEEVSLPKSWVVVTLEINCLWDWKYVVTTHYRICLFYIIISLSCHYGL